MFARTYFVKIKPYTIKIKLYTKMILGLSIKDVAAS
jgi:hypothetical protein